MKILISIRTSEELSAALKGEADIIDLKNPKEGSLGAACPLFTKKIRASAPNQLISVAIGDMPNLPCTAALAARGAATLKTDYIKIGLYGASSYVAALKLLKKVVGAVKDFDPNIKVVGVGYADAVNFGGVNPLKIPEIAENAGADVAMLDTFNKDGKKLFDFLSLDQLERFVKKSHRFGLLAALAGSLRKEDLSTIYQLDTDITGLRGAVCNNNDRKNGLVSEQKVANIMTLAHNLNF